MKLIILQEDLIAREKLEKFNVCTSPIELLKMTKLNVFCAKFLSYFYIISFAVLLQIFQFSSSYINEIGGVSILDKIVSH